MNRYTKKQLDELSDVKFAQLILQERLNSLTNPYSPLSTKLRCAIKALNMQEEHSRGELHMENAKSISENQTELFKLIQDNPDLPVMPMVDGEIVAGDDYGYWQGAWGTVRIDEYLKPKSEYDYIRFKSDDDVFDVLEHYLTDEEFEALPETEEECRPIYNALPWIKVIVVYITLPD